MYDQKKPAKDGYQSIQSYGQVNQSSLFLRPSSCFVFRRFKSPKRPRFISVAILDLVGWDTIPLDLHPLLRPGQESVVRYGAWAVVVGWN